MMSAGFFGKIPTRGDFVRYGLPAGAVAALDAWWQRVIPGSRALLGEASWQEAWMQAPVWRFVLSPGWGATGALAGLWVPSTDSAGRLFPLLIALSGPWADGLEQSGGFLDAAEAAALHVLTDDVGPEELAAVVSAAASAPPASLPPPSPGTGRWWTWGGPFVAPATLSLAGLPDERCFASMLRDDGRM